MSERTAIYICAQLFAAAGLAGYMLDVGPALVAVGWIYFIAMIFWFCDYQRREDAKEAERARIRREILR